MKIKNVVFSVVMALAFLVTPLCAGDMVTYPVAELDMEVSLPAEYNYVFTRDISEDDPILADWGITKSELFKNDFIYLEALSENQNEEVVLSMLQTDWSEMYYDFNDLSEADLTELAEYCLMNNSSEVEMEYSDYGLFRQNDSAQFLQAVGTFQSDDAKGSAVQYVTVMNGNAYTITFNFYGEDVSEEHIAMSEEVISSVVFPAAGEPSTDNNLLFYMVSVIVLLVVIGLLLAVIRKKKYSIKNPEGDPSMEAFLNRQSSAETVREEEPQKNVNQEAAAAQKESEKSSGKAAGGKNSADSE